MRRAAVALALCLGCAVGGAVDREYPSERRVLRELPAGARLVVEIRGVHHGGAAPGCAAQSEAGLSYTGARPGDRFSTQLEAELPGGRRASVASFARLPSRAEVEALLSALRIESCAGGGRLALRVSRGAPGTEWRVLAPGASPRGGVTRADTCAAALTTEPLVWSPL